MNNDIGTVIKSTTQVRGGYRVVNDQGSTVAMGNLRQLFNINDISRRIADRFAEDRPGFLVNEPLHGCVVIKRGETDIDSLSGQGVRKEIVGAAIRVDWC